MIHQMVQGHIVMRFRLEESLKTCNMKRAARKQKMGKSKITTYSCNMKRVGRKRKMGGK